ncbi:MAG: hypothetical protein J6O56_01365 [Bacilli bacterium]|nr:hypothetical protein [Bacilli bacterium]
MNRINYMKYGISEGLEICNDGHDINNYHHNTEYKNLLTILKYGILTINDLQKEQIRYFSKEQLKNFDDIESHINGIDGISLSRVGLTDIYPGEDIYEPFHPCSVDIIISSNVKAARNSLHYGNEYICYSKIPISKIISFDFRILKLIENCDYENVNELNRVISKYNYLITAIKKIHEDRIPMLFKEMSNGSSVMNISKISKLELLPTEDL